MPCARVLAFADGSHQGGRRVIIIEPAEALNLQAANALLKVLEEPPANVVFILVSHHSERLLPTILSRLQVWHLPTFSRRGFTMCTTAGIALSPSQLAFQAGAPLLQEDASLQDFAGAVVDGFGQAAFINFIGFCRRIRQTQAPPG